MICEFFSCPQERLCSTANADARPATSHSTAAEENGGSVATAMHMRQPRSHKQRRNRPLNKKATSR